MRGTGSLHALLGRDVTKKRKRSQPSATTESSPGHPQQAVPGDAQGTAGLASYDTAQEVVEHATEAAVPARNTSRPAQRSAAAAARPASPLKAGHVRCPVCDCQLPNDVAKVNAHVDKCLSKGALQKRTLQASIFQFARQPAAAVQQRQQGHDGGVSSAPAATAQAAAVLSPAAGRRRSSGAAALALAAEAAAAATQRLGAAAAPVVAGAGSAGAQAAADAEAPTAAAAIVDLTGYCQQDAGGPAAAPKRQVAVASTAEPADGVQAAAPCHHRVLRSRGAAAAATAAAGAASGAGSRQQQQQQCPQPAVQSPSVSWPSQDSDDSQDVQQQDHCPAAKLCNEQHPHLQQRLQRVTPSGPVSRQAQQQVQQQAQQQAQHVPARPSNSRQQQRVQQHTPVKPGSSRRQAVGQQGMPARSGSKQQQQQQEPAGGLRCFMCSVVGRQFHRYDVPCQSGQRLVVEWEKDNKKDGNALLALDSQSRCPLGHLPQVVSRHLAPLLKNSQVVVEAVVQEEPLSDKAHLLVELQVTLQPPAPGTSPAAAGRVAAALGRAEAAAAARLQQQPQATGERLHANFLEVLKTVQQHDGHLLADLETGFIAAYKELPLPCQCLFLRLFQRKGPTFSVASLSYQEVPDVAAAASQLAAAGLAAVVAADDIGSGHGRAGHAAAAAAAGADAEDDAIDWRQLADLLTVPELAAVLAARRVAAAAPPAGGGGSSARQGSSFNRQQLLAALERHAAKSAAAGAQLAGWLLEATGPVLHLANSACEAVSRLQRLFFLNEGHSLSQFLAADLGALKYPQYQVHRTCAVFSCRQDLLDYEQALGYAAELSDALEDGDTEAAEAVLQHAWAALDASMHKKVQESNQGFHKQYSAGWVYCTMATAGVSLLERQRRYKEAIDRLEMLLGGQCCLSRRGEWWERLCINLEHLDRPTLALERAEAALADEWLSSGDRLALQRRVLRLGKPPRRWKRPPWAEAAQREPPVVRIEGRPLNSVTGTKSRFYGLDDEQCSVEELALQYYATPEAGEWQGVHSEGGIWATLFGLLLWDALFMPVPDVFRTPFQTAPLDLDTAAFYPTRKDAVEACLARVAAGDAPRLLRATWEQHQGTLCRGVSWDRHSLEELQLVAECIGGPGLVAVCRLLAQDHAGWSGGMPDLLLWHAGRREAKLAEVKGPRDRLSSSQIAWMNALAAAGLRAEVLKVEEPQPANGKKGKKR